MRRISWLVLLAGFASSDALANPERDQDLQQVQCAQVVSGSGAEPNLCAPIAEAQWSTPSMLLSDFSSWVERINPKFPPDANSLSPEVPFRRNEPTLLQGSELHRHWRNPQFELMGDSQYTRDRGRENIGVSASNLIHANHLLNLDYRTSDAMRVQDQSTGYGFNYAFPVASSWFEIGLSHSENENTVVNSDNKYDASSEIRVFNFSGRRSLHEWRYLSLDGTISFFNRNARVFEEGRWVEDSRHQLSRFRLDGRSRYELAFDVLATTQVSVVGGVDVNGAKFESNDGYLEDDSFHKFVIAGALSRELRYWTLGVSGRYQFSPGDMPSAEYMKIAGSGLISGFSGHSMSSPVGGWLRMDASSPAFIMPFTSHLLSDVRLSVLRGWMPGNLDERNRYDSASAAELSLGFHTHGLNADISVGRMLNETKLTPITPNIPDVSLSLSLGI